ncbi:hypothetical protein EV200_108196 [Pedobacter psychrotolerans]|uniref:Methyltransferase family protein n=1 Tax=Pedobacter psychrotolerans TaxID=1843235 RepID=A0A4R2H8H3_9SPHI|nr:hypothetical protein [Pedobacter psychrotolerans]TCO20755.1 hypothetical protein EV200_108196 [Pedobacter psychrotolerans]GGE67830.1 hypothetical protein GCM10011413_38130 [Pedobacter psychrotolerans]
MLPSQNLKDKLINISHDLLLPQDFHNKLAPAITSYTELLFELGEIKHDEISDRTHIQSKFGSAIGTFWAANCVKEVLRTQRFVRGLHLAIKDKLLHKDGPIHVLYAGTGPFATLALPVMVQFSPAEVQFTLLEINENSYNKLVDVINAFDLNSYVKAIEIVDATSYVLPDDCVDIVISETLNRALITEPQVFIMLNLASQLGEDVIYLPEEITVNLCVKRRNENKPTKLKTLINFNVDKMKEIIDRSENLEWTFDEIKVNIKNIDPADLYYSTELKVYRDNFLGYEDSSLNLLEKVKLEHQKGDDLIFKYAAAVKPGFVAYSGEEINS